MSEDPVFWVVGARGLLGSAVMRELRRLEHEANAASVPWGDREQSVRALDEVAAAIAACERPWRLLWCAGAGVVGTGAEGLAQEVEVVQQALGSLASRLAASDHAPRGGVFLASSAGGVFAGSDGPPFTERSVPRAISPYGEAKLASEHAFEEFAAATGVPTLIGRIANLYGPGQDVTKAQGLISQLCLAHLRRSPIGIYVPLDSARDYLFVDDCARMLVDGLEYAVANGGFQLKILASQQATTIASILAELRRVTKRRPQVVLATSPSAAYQAKDLRFRSEVMNALDRHASTTLAAGIKATLESLGAELRAGHLTARQVM